MAGSAKCLYEFKIDLNMVARLKKTILGSITLVSLTARKKVCPLNPGANTLTRIGEAKMQRTVKIAKIKKERLRRLEARFHPSLSFSLAR
jgi:hypothetical protein